MNPYHHALSSAEKYGGQPEDYLPLHQWFDESKAMLPDFRHRALRHHAEGIFLMERIFGVTLTNSAGRTVPTRFIGEQHVKEDLGRIPTAQDWLECIAPRPWMLKSGKADQDQSAQDNTSPAVVIPDEEPCKDVVSQTQSALGHPLTVGQLIAHLQQLARQSPLGEDTCVCLCRPDEDYQGLLVPILDIDPDGAVVLLMPVCEGCGLTPGVRIDADPGCQFELALPPEFVIIERCDACDRFADDLAAAQSVANHAHWIVCTTGHRHAVGLPRRKEEHHAPPPVASV